MYFDSTVRPHPRPFASHQTPRWLLSSRASAQSVKLQNSSWGRSGVARIPPHALPARRKPLQLVGGIGEWQGHDGRGRRAEQAYA